LKSLHKKTGAEEVGNDTSSGVTGTITRVAPSVMVPLFIYSIDPILFYDNGPTHAWFETKNGVIVGAGLVEGVF